jgi:hypothetical protein
MIFWSSDAYCCVQSPKVCIAAIESDLANTNLAREAIRVSQERASQWFNG